MFQDGSIKTIWCQSSRGKCWDILCYGSDSTQTLRRVSIRSLPLEGVPALRLSPFLYVVPSSVQLTTDRRAQSAIRKSPTGHQNRPEPFFRSVRNDVDPEWSIMRRIRLSFYRDDLFPPQILQPWLHFWKNVDWFQSLFLLTISSTISLSFQSSFHLSLTVLVRYRSPVNI